MGYFDEKAKEVVTLTVAINECLTSNGEKKWGTSKGKMAHLQSYFANEAKEAEKVIDVKIDSADAAAAYERGKEYYYTQRGYLKLNCANCHIQGAGHLFFFVYFNLFFYNCISSLFFLF